MQVIAAQIVKIKLEGEKEMSEILALQNRIWLLTNRDAVINARIIAKLKRRLRIAQAKREQK